MKRIYRTVDIVSDNQQDGTPYCFCTQAAATPIESDDLCTLYDYVCEAEKPKKVRQIDIRSLIRNAPDVVLSIESPFQLRRFIGIKQIVIETAEKEELIVIFKASDNLSNKDKATLTKQFESTIESYLAAKTAEIKK